MHTNQQLQIRNARPQDVNDAVLLINSAGPQAIDYGFTCDGKASHDFLKFAFTDGGGFLGYRNHTVATLNEQVVGINASYNYSTYLQLIFEHLTQLWRFYPAQSFLNLTIRGLDLKSSMPPPTQKMHYVANFAVAKAFQSLGIGRSLLDHQFKKAQALGRTVYALDVSVDNSRAQTLYESYGFSVTSENKFSGPTGKVPNTRRMTMPVRTN